MNKKEPSLDNDIESALEESFLSSIKKGSKLRNLIAIFQQMDVPIIKSLLSSKMIVHHCPYNNLMQDPGNPFIIAVLEDNYDEAKSILTDYVNSRKDEAKQKGKWSNIIQSNTPEFFS